jgi:predicted nucleic acid-binding protein
VKLAQALAGVKTLYLDTAPVIYHVEGNPSYKPLMDVILQAVDSGALAAVTGPITLAECLVQPYLLNNVQLIDAFRDLITAGKNTQFVALKEQAEAGAALRAKYNLGLADSLQFATALSASCDAFLTNDLGLKRVTELTILVLDDLEI